MAMFPLTSSNLKGADYDPSTSDLAIYFLKGAVWVYHQVPYTVFHDLVTSESPGSYYSVYIKGTYSGEQIQANHKKQVGEVPEVKQIPPPPI